MFMHIYMYIFKREKSPFKFPYAVEHSFQDFPHDFFLFLASDKFCSSCQRMQKEKQGVGGTLSLLWSSSEGDLC